MERVFYILWNPEGQRPPTRKFDSYDEAAEVAQAMQLRIGVGTMYILKAVQAVSVVQDVKWVGFKEKKNVG